MTNTTSAELVGLNLTRVRTSQGHSQAECARRVSELGLNWAQSHVSALEGGRRVQVSIDELIVLSEVYQCGLSSWFEGDDSLIDITSVFSVPRSSIANLLNGAAPSGTVIDFSPAEDFSADGRIADNLRIEQSEVTRLAVEELWGHSATVERDKRLRAAHPDITNPKELRTKRSGVTRRLKNEIARHVAEHADE